MKFSHQNIKLRKAFSLIEISVVLLIIGMLIAGISQGIDLYSEFKIKTAQKLTINSPVSRIEGLALWLETTLEKSFQTKMVNNSSVPRWNNISPFDLNPKNAFNYSTNQPIFLENHINGLPAIKFSKDYGNCMSVESGFDNNTENVTIFLALTLNSLINYGKIIEKWHNPSDPYPYVLRQYFALVVYGGENASGYNSAALTGSSSIKVGVPYIVSARRVKSVNLSIWLNGTKKGDNADTSTINTINNSPLYIGCRGGAPTATSGSGDFNVGEIIIYSRALSDIEISRVNQYLSQKWNIKF